LKGERSEVSRSKDSEEERRRWPRKKYFNSKRLSSRNRRRRITYNYSAAKDWRRSLTVIELFPRHHRHHHPLLTELLLQSPSQQLPSDRPFAPSASNWGRGTKGRPLAEERKTLPVKIQIIITVVLRITTSKIRPVLPSAMESIIILLLLPPLEQLPKQQFPM